MKGEMICSTHSNIAIRETMQEITACSMTAGTSPASPQIQSLPSSRHDTTSDPRRPARASSTDRSASMGVKYASTVCGFAIAT